jgi:hypothetical protein
MNERDKKCNIKNCHRVMWIIIHYKFTVKKDRKEAETTVVVLSSPSNGEKFAD